MQLILDNIIPIKFYPYPHVVMKRLISSLPEYSNQSSKYIWYRKWLSELFNNAGIKNTIDNKIVFEVEIEGIHFFIGFYDWVMSIGFGIHKIWKNIYWDKIGG